MILSSSLPHVLSSTDDFINEEELLAEDWSNVEELLLDDVVVPNVGGCSRQGLTSSHINTKWLEVLHVFLLDLEQSILGIESRVLGQGSWNGEKSIGKGHNSKLDLALDLLSGVLLQMLSSSNLKGSGSWDDGTILTGVLDGTESITDGVLGLSNTVVVWSLDQDGAGEWVLDSLDEGVLVITERLLVDKASKTKILLSDAIDGVELLATTGQRDSLSVSSLASADSDDSGAGKNLKRWWVNSLLVDHNEVLVGALAKLVLQVDDLVNLIVSVLSLTLNQLLSLIGI